MVSISNPYADIFALADPNASRQQVAGYALAAEIDAAKKQDQTSGKEPMNKAQAAKVASEFESIFLAQMLTAMNPLKKEGENKLFSQQGDDAFHKMMMEEYAKEISKSGGIGIADQIARELSGEVSQNNRIVEYQLKIGTYQKAQEAAEQATPTEPNLAETL